DGRWILRAFLLHALMQIDLRTCIQRVAKNEFHAFVPLIEQRKQISRRCDVSKSAHLSESASELLPVARAANASHSPLRQRFSPSSMSILGAIVRIFA